MDFLNKLEEDKVKHALAGMMVYGLFATINPTIGLTATIAAGLTKEMVDLFSTRRFEWGDLLATSLGGGYLYFFDTIKYLYCSGFFNIN